MALLNRPITAVEIRHALAEWRKERRDRLLTFYDVWKEALENLTPHVVRYSAADNRTTYIPPTMFHWHVHPASPSDCVWIVPDTHTREFNNATLYRDAMTYGIGYTIDGHHVRYSTVMEIEKEKK